MVDESRSAATPEMRIIIGLLSLLCVMGLGAVLYQGRSIVLPLALAVFIGYIINPLISFLEKRRVPLAISIIIAVLLTFIMMGVMTLLIKVSIDSFTAEFPRYEQKFNLLLENLLRVLQVPPELISEQLKGAERIQALTGLDSFSITGVITTTLGSITKFLSNTVLVLLFLMFILLGRNQLTRKLQVAFDPALAARLANISGNINQQIQQYIITKTLISFVTAALVTIVLYAFGVQFAMIWGILTFLLNFIPSVGSVVSTILPVLMAFIQFDSYLTIILITGLLILIQFVMGNIFDPRLVGRSVNLSPLVILFSLIFWNWLLGPVGMFLATPLSVIIKIVFENISSLHFVSVLMSGHPPEK